MKHPESAEIDVVSQDGTMLRLTLHQDEATRRFTYDSDLGVQEHTPHGLRPLFGYKAGAIHQVDRTRGLGLHDRIPNLRIGGHWLIVLSDWIEMLTEESVDRWKDGT